MGSEGEKFARVEKWKDTLSHPAFDPVWFVHCGGESVTFTFERDAQDFAEAINAAHSSAVEEAEDRVWEEAAKIAEDYPHHCYSSGARCGCLPDIASALRARRAGDGK